MILHNNISPIKSATSGKGFLNLLRTGQDESVSTCQYSYLSQIINPIIISSSTFGAAVLLTIFTSTSQAVNVTVDDTDPAWTYNAVNGQGWASNPCSICVEQPNKAMAYNETWHDTDVAGDAASITFQGTSGTVYGILPATYNGSSTGANYSFYLNNVLSGTFVRDLTTSFSYNVSLFSFSGLNPTSETTLTVVNGAWPNGLSIILLDYFVYDSSQNSTTNATSANSTVTANASITTITASSNSRVHTPDVVAPITTVALLIAAAAALW